jgi:hypothetical protein
MSRWTWPDTLLTLAAVILTIALAASLRADGAATCQTVREVPKHQMSDNPFAASAAWRPDE